jgi:acetaldehyde dehydrogenase (acetylating)
VILEFGLHKPAYRICVNTPTTHGSIGLTTGLDPAMTLGCGGFGGNITSDNISPRHLLNIKRLAYELRPAQRNRASTDVTTSAATPAGPRLPQSPMRTTSKGISGDVLSRRIDSFLQSRGFAPGALAARPVESERSAKAAVGLPNPPPADFVCEDDVRRAIQTGTRIALAERSIVTPAARELGDSHNIFDLPGVTLPR